MVDALIVLLIVGGCVMYLSRRALLSFHGKGSSCGCGCTGNCTPGSTSCKPPNQLKTHIEQLSHPNVHQDKK
jgi:hypothetical protein